MSGRVPPVKPNTDLREHRSRNHRGSSSRLPGETALDRFVSSPAALMLAFGWGFAEATFFFIVPDVLLTLLACRMLRPALKATAAALVGALIGGAAAYTFGLYAPEAARSFLDHIPAIKPALVSWVESQIDEAGLKSLMLGPLRGVPYKIYAVEWGARGGGFTGFILMSVPARSIRFLLAALAAWSIARLIKPYTYHRARIEVSLLALFWVAFYAFYFARFG